FRFSPGTCEAMGDWTSGFSQLKLLCASTMGNWRSQRRPMFRVRRRLTRQSSCTKYDCHQLWVMVGVAMFRREVELVSARPRSAEATELPAVLDALKAFGPWVNVRENAKLRSPGVLVKRLAKSRRIWAPNLIS